jgi:hypothetical protein
MVHPPCVRGSLVPLLSDYCSSSEGFAGSTFLGCCRRDVPHRHRHSTLLGCLEHYSSGEWHWDFQHGVSADHPANSAAVDADYHSATSFEGSDPGSID